MEQEVIHDSLLFRFPPLIFSSLGPSPLTFPSINASFCHRRDSVREEEKLQKTASVLKSRLFITSPRSCCHTAGGSGHLSLSLSLTTFLFFFHQFVLYSTLVACDGSSPRLCITAEGRHWRSLPSRISPQSRRSQTCESKPHAHKKKKNVYFMQTSCKMASSATLRVGTIYCDMYAKYSEGSEMTA